jgi:4,5-dihydroxyphthalate decarboxylase
MDLLKAAGYKTSLPWVSQKAEETRALMGEHFCPYGIEPNRKSLAALLRYSYEQGLSKGELSIEELFHPSTFHLTESF